MLCSENPVLDVQNQGQVSKLNQVLSKSWLMKIRFSWRMSKLKSNWLVANVCVNQRNVMPQSSGQSPEKEQVTTYLKSQNPGLS